MCFFLSLSLASGYVLGDACMRALCAGILRGLSLGSVVVMKVIRGREDRVTRRDDYNEQMDTGGRAGPGSGKRVRAFIRTCQCDSCYNEDHEGSLADTEFQSQCNDTFLQKTHNELREIRVKILGMKA